MYYVLAMEAFTKILCKIGSHEENGCEWHDIGHLDHM